MPYLNSNVKQILFLILFFQPWQLHYKLWKYFPIYFPICSFFHLFLLFFVNECFLFQSSLRAAIWNKSINHSIEWVKFICCTSGDINSNHMCLLCYGNYGHQYSILNIRRCHKNSWFHIPRNNLWNFFVFFTNTNNIEITLRLKFTPTNSSKVVIIGAFALKKKDLCAPRFKPSSFDE